jgi:MoxR-like ATPase
MATQNPVEHEGTFPLPEAQLDRFLMKVIVGYPSGEAEAKMLELHEGGFDPEKGGAMAIVESVLSAEQARACRQLVDQVRVAPEVREYISSITRATRDDPSFVLGASPRASVALMRASRASAVMDARDFVTPDDVKARAHAVLRHRIILAPELGVEGRTTDEALTAVLARTTAPT